MSLVLACVVAGTGYVYLKTEETKRSTQFNIVLGQAANATEQLLLQIKELRSATTKADGKELNLPIDHPTVIGIKKEMIKALGTLEDAFYALELSDRGEILGITESQRLSGTQEEIEQQRAPLFSSLHGLEMPASLRGIWDGRTSDFSLRNTLLEVISQANRLDRFNDFTSTAATRIFRQVRDLGTNRLRPGLAWLNQRLGHEIITSQKTLRNAMTVTATMMILACLVVGLTVLLPLENAVVRAREELEKSRDEEAAARIAAQSADRTKSEFLANMSHEIRTPMNGVMGMAELLARSELDARQKTFVDVIVKSGNALLTIINDILDFSKIDANQMELMPAPFQLGEAVEDVATLISAKAAEKNLELIVHLDQELPLFVMGDVGRFRQIVTNLVGNAIKFTENGHVLLEVTNETKDGVANIRISVTDTGVGIPEDKLKNVFDKFAQVDGSSTRRHEGTGLGLAIASRLVELMGGEIGASSVYGQGSTFWFTLPLQVVKGKKKVVKTPVDISNVRILVIDDNPINRTILNEQLSSWGFDSAAASNGKEGLAFVERTREIGATIDCIIMDYQMPEMNGEQTVMALKEKGYTNDIPVIMLTSVDQSDLSHLMSSHGVAAQLTKPARSSLIHETLLEVIHGNRHKLQNNHGEKNTVDMNAPPRSITFAKPAFEEGVGSGRLEENNSLAGQTSSTPDLYNEERPQKVFDITETKASGPAKINVLVAEDNEINQFVFSQILNRMKLTYKIVENGELAVRAHEKLKPDLILMDVSMPQLNGLEATRLIREADKRNGAHTAIIGVTAHALKGDHQKCIQAGMDDYLAKPISPDKMTEKIQEWLNWRRKHIA